MSPSIFSKNTVLDNSDIINVSMKIDTSAHSGKVKEMMNAARWCKCHSLEAATGIRSSGISDSIQSGALITLCSNPDKKKHPCIIKHTTGDSSEKKETFLLLMPLGPFFEELSFRTSSLEKEKKRNKI